MSTLKQLLLESFSVYSIHVILKIRTDSEKNLTNAYDAVRSVPYVIIAHPRKSDGVSSRSDDKYKYAQVELKFMVIGDNAMEELERIKHLAMRGEDETGEFKVKGLVGFILRTKTLHKIK